MSMTYIQALSKGFPGVQVECAGDGSVYENLVWVSGDALPSKTQLDAYVQANENIQLDTFGSIENGYALSIARLYPVFTINSHATKNVYLNTLGGVPYKVGYYIWRDAMIVAGVAQLESSATGSASFKLRKNGLVTDLHSIDISSGETTKHSLIYLPVSAGDTIQVYVSSSANGAYPTLTLELAWRL